MAKQSKTKISTKIGKKTVKAEIIGKLEDALKEYNVPGFEKKLSRKIKKASKSITLIVLKSKKKAAQFPEKKSA